MSPQYRLTYFDNRGPAEPARFVFAYCGVEYEDRRVTAESWKELKPNYEWGTLPLLEEDGKSLGQSNSILRYLGKKYNLCGENDFESAKCDEMVEACYDLRTAIAKSYYEKDEARKAELQATVKNETLPKLLGVWDKTVSSNGGFLVGKKFTYADFCIASWINIFNEYFGGKLLDDFPALKKHYDSVFNAKGIKDWVAKRPITQF